MPGESRGGEASPLPAPGDPPPASPDLQAQAASGRPSAAAPPGTCTLPAAHAIDAALARSDAGDANADLDLAACWRLLAQPYPERVALARALERGLADDVVPSVRGRLDELGGPPPVVGTEVPSAPGTEDPQAGAENASLPSASSDPQSSSVPAYVLGGVSLAGLLGGTAMGLAALYEHSRSEAEVVETTWDEELGIAAGACAAVGIAAGIAALVLWPGGETGPTAGPGDVGLGWEVRF